MHASPGVLQLVVAAYGVVYASLVVIGGRLGDSHGRRRMLSIGLVLFAVTGLLCAVAQSSEVLIGARLLQGATAALVAPQVLASIHANTDGHHRVRAMALFGATAGVAFSVAFLAGGILTDSSLGWRSLFWVTSALVAVVIVVVLRYLPESKAPTPSRLDIGGAALLGILMTLLVLPLTEGRALGWPAWTWVCLAGTPVAAAAFVWWQARLERRASIPLVPLSLFRFRSVSAGLGIGLPMYVAFSGFTFVFSITAATRGLSAVEIGTSMLPLGLAFLWRSGPRSSAPSTSAGTAISRGPDTCSRSRCWRSAVSLSRCRDRRLAERAQAARCFFLTGLPSRVTRRRFLTVIPSGRVPSLSMRIGHRLQRDFDTQHSVLGGFLFLPTPEG
nr:MFS transporter [Nocardioides sp. KC13]